MLVKFTSYLLYEENTKIARHMWKDDFVNEFFVLSLKVGEKLVMSRLKIFKHRKDLIQIS